MKIGIVVHSHTGNTYSVAKKLQEKLLKAEHQVSIERIQVAGGENPNVKDFRLENPPDAGAYDALIFGAPVRGGALSPVMAAYLKQLPSLAVGKAACYVTKFFPTSRMGGQSAISKMTELCSSKGASISATGIVSWLSWKREKQINDVVERLGGIFIET